MTHYSRVVGVALLVLVVTSCSSSSSTDSSGANDEFSIDVNGTSYIYQCAPKEKGPEINTDGCGWPMSSPTLQVDVSFQSATPQTNLSFDLSQSADLQVTLGMTKGTEQAIYATYDISPSGQYSVTAGASGSAKVNSWDGVNGKADVELSNVVLLLSTRVTSNYPGAPSKVTIRSARLVRPGS
jgi:hypothetical protein